MQLEHSFNLMHVIIVVIAEAADYCSAHMIASSHMRLFFWSIRKHVLSFCVFGLQCNKRGCFELYYPGKDQGASYRPAELSNMRRARKLVDVQDYMGFCMILLHRNTRCRPFHIVMMVKLFANLCDRTAQHGSGFTLYIVGSV